MSLLWSFSNFSLSFSIILPISEISKPPEYRFYRFVPIFGVLQPSKYRFYQFCRFLGYRFLSIFGISQPSKCRFYRFLTIFGILQPPKYRFSPIFGILQPTECRFYRFLRFDSSLSSKYRFYRCLAVNCKPRPLFDVIIHLIYVYFLPLTPYTIPIIIRQKIRRSAAHPATLRRTSAHCAALRHTPTHSSALRRSLATFLANYERYCIRCV